MEKKSKTDREIDFVRRQEGIWTLYQDKDRIGLCSKANMLADGTMYGEVNHRMGEGLRSWVHLGAYF